MTENKDQDYIATTQWSKRERQFIKVVLIGGLTQAILIPALWIASSPIDSYAKPYYGPMDERPGLNEEVDW